MRNPRHAGGSGELTIVIKLGSTSIVAESNFQPQLALLSAIVESICGLRKLGHKVVLVSSGAIAMGLKRMELKKRPKALSEKQVNARCYHMYTRSSLIVVAILYILPVVPALLLYRLLLL